MPNRFHRRNKVPRRNRSSAATRAATQGAVIAMMISPRPAGHANPPGSSPSILAIRNPSPMNRHPFIDMRRTGETEVTRARQPGRVRSVTRYKRIGTVKANPTATGGLFGPLMNVPRSASQQIALNHPTPPRRRGQCCCACVLTTLMNHALPLTHVRPVPRQLVKNRDYTHQAR